MEIDHRALALQVAVVCVVAEGADLRGALRPARPAKFHEGGWDEREREDERVGEVAVHFPSQGFQVNKVT